MSATAGARALSPITLNGAVVRLEPLTIEHLEQLCEVGLDPDLWRWTTSEARTREDMRRYIETALEWQLQGTALPFATVEQASHRVIGSTRFMNIDLANRRAEIGATWIARQWQRTAVNTEAKYMMLRHAFETLGFMRVELKTDVLNTTSRNAILRIGAKQEGIFRKHMVCENGRIRDTVYFSIIDTEWAEVKAALEAKLGR
jgi:RimJ/RimL family protein N-acetyltransferase